MFLARFGAHRLMWASFFPAYRSTSDGPLKGLLEYVRAQLAFLPAADLDLLLGETARSLYPSLSAAPTGGS
jgi:predicted TIM-barrel fold metal-dependent hydrolase